MAVRAQNCWRSPPQRFLSTREIFLTSGSIRDTSIQSWSVKVVKVRQLLSKAK